tara:strand:+ start:102 stop:677 length:576 start_codon:yes stop_codon:yes gene_type:complete
MFKEYKLPFDSFIGGWFIPKKTCDDIVKYFDENEEMRTQGKFGTNNEFYVDKKTKDSTDISINNYNLDDEIIEYRKQLQKVLNLYQKRYETVKNLSKFNLEGFNIQKYPKKGGYKIWHNERRSPFTARRVLTFMTYLNDCDSGGTEFMYQKLITPAKKGLTLIWPVDFTHIHRSQICNQEKIITTGWFYFI